MKKYDIIIIGAGASGLIAAGRAGELGAKVLVIEKMRQAGRKLAITGKGRCNITNTSEYKDFISHVYPNGRFLGKAFGTFFNEDVISLLERNGLKTVRERGGRVFPESNKAPDVVKALLSWIKNFEVDFQYDSIVKELLVNDAKITGVVFENGGKKVAIEAEKVIIATGGKSYPATGSTGDGYKLLSKLGHKIITTRQSLVPMESKEDIPKKLVDLNLKNVNASLWINDKKAKEEFGELLFMDFGLSGPITLRMSRDAVDALNDQKKVEIKIDLKPALEDAKLDQRLLKDINAFGNEPLYSLCRKWMPKQLVDYFISKIEIDAKKLGNQLSSKERKRIKRYLKELSFEIKNPRSFKEAIITAGGVSTKEVDSKTMKSKIVDGLYIVGELLDLDADTGGYNLQIAFSTAWLAAESAFTLEK